MNKLEYKLPSPLKAGGDPVPGSTYSTTPQGSRGGGNIPFTPVTGAGVPPDFDDITVFCNDVYVREQHLTVIRRGPTMPPALELYSWDAWDENSNTGVEDLSGDDNIKLSHDFYGASVGHFSAVASLAYYTNTIPAENITTFYNATKELKTVGDEVRFQIDLTGAGPDWGLNTILITKYSYTNSLGIIQTASFRGRISNVVNNGLSSPGTSLTAYIDVELLSVPFNFPLYPNLSQIFTATAVRKNIIFEYKFPKFAYRYQYDDGEYSTFSPWSEIAFIPEKFDYLPKKGYNLGMTNNLRTLKVKNWRPKNIPKDVVAIDLLYKESNSPNIYTVESFDINDKPTSPWNLPGTGNHFGDYTISSELIHQVVASNQLLRPWDNVPRVALGQEVTANRLIYANYLQNYNLFDTIPDGVGSSFSLKYLKPVFSVSTETVDHSIDGDDYEANPMNLSLHGWKNQPRFPMKSLKSMRTYQLGVVYRDRYGRETPVLTSDSGSIRIPKTSAKLQSRLAVQLQNAAPYWAESYTFYVKETANEYYNLSLDRWYDAEDGGIWLAFPSSERNKIDEGSIIILKKQHGNDKPVESDTKYKVIDIKNNAPSFIKTDTQYWGVVPMMLPPPGWGIGGRVGGWDSGMFHPTGLPLPDRLYLDIYAEYFDQSVLAGLSNKAGAQIRMIQSPGASSSYTTWSSAHTNKSKWYDIANVNYIGAPEQVYSETETNSSGVDVTVVKEIPGQPEQLVRITLGKLMGNDMAFCEPEDDLSLNRGLSLEARTRTSVDKAKFHGRFFAKIHRDSGTNSNIIYPQQKTSERYQVLMAKEIKYLCFAHPGVQDWRTDAVNTWGGAQTTFGRWYQGGAHHNSYLSSINLNYIPPAFDPKQDPDHKKFHDPTNFGYKKREVSSFSATVGDLGTFTGTFPLHGGVTISPGYVEGPPQTSPYYWPIGPGWHASDVYNQSGSWADQGYASTYSNFAYGNGTNLPRWPVAAKNNHGWPAFGPDHWAPNSTIDTSWAFGVSWDPPGSYTYTGPGGAPNIQAGANWNAGLQINENDEGSDDAFMEQIAPANPYQVPAIWGDQRDFFGGGASIHTDLAAGTAVSAGTQNDSFWDSSTIDKLREKWKNLYWGRRDVDAQWPPCHASTERWFFDKVGAAKGYSGNGIWEEDGVTKMHISFFGIGDPSHRHRSHELVTHQENEVPFAEVLSTVGTRFRFRSDPDQTIYSVTRVEGPELIYNYETPRGTWGYAEDDGTGTSVLVPESGNGIGKNNTPPFGLWEQESGSIANKQAFVSDIFKDKAKLSEENTGGAPYNYRIRYTLTLDKIVGVGASGFHPILKHVDDAGDCNIEMGPKVYWSGANPSLSPPTWKGNYNPEEEDGGTILPVAMYNLHSYWNYDITDPASVSTTPPTQQQSKTDGVGNINNMRFGLHEAGLNGTWLEIITPYTEEEMEDTVSTNPAVFETEPKEDVGLDIYYAASPTYPINLKRWRSDRLTPDPIDYHRDGNNYALLNSETGAYYHDYGWRGEEMIPIGATVELLASGNGVALNTASVVAVQENTVWLNNVVKDNGSGTPLELSLGDELKISWKNEGAFYGGKKDDVHIIVTVDSGIGFYTAKLTPTTHASKHVIPYFNCYTFANGVESNRIRDDYNAVTIDKGVKASMPLAEKYVEERRGSSLIFSGIYNSTSGINRTNQFIQAEPITKEINPINGTIQKLFARDTDLITFCENKVFKILANKDALFSAGGDVNLTSTARVLGQVVPFVGDYGISKNPESFASESYRAYFADKNRGTILRLSRDGLTPISDYGMKDWFKDNLMFATSVIGSYDDSKGQYNITVETKDRDDNQQAYTLSYVEKKRGWESFKSWVHQGGISHKSVYYTFPSNKYYYSNKLDNWGVPYMPTNIFGWAETFEHNLDLITKRFPSITYNNATDIILNSPFNGVIIVGMNVEGNGIPYGTTVTTVNYSTNLVTLSNLVFVDVNSELTFTMPRNYFYHIPDHYSMLKVLFNGQQGSVKRFKTLNYEGSQAKVDIEDATTPDEYNLYGVTGDTATLPVYYDNWDKDGWYIENMFTDCQKGNINEFIDKECKWFNYIRGYEDSGAKDFIDTAQFSSQGLGFTGCPNLPEYPGTEAGMTAFWTAVLTNPSCVVGNLGGPMSGLNFSACALTGDGGYLIGYELMTNGVVCDGNAGNLKILIAIPGWMDAVASGERWSWQLLNDAGAVLKEQLSIQQFYGVAEVGDVITSLGPNDYTMVIQHWTGGVSDDDADELICEWTFTFNVDCGSGPS